MNDAEFDALYQRSFGPLTGQVYLLCGNRAEAADCVQEAFIRAWSQRGRLRVEGSPEAWVRTTAYRLAVSRWRRDRRQSAALPAEVAGSAGPDVDHVLLQRALAQLPDRQRQALVLHHVAGLPVADVASELGAPVGTVKAWLSRGRTALAALVGDETKETVHA